jgi:hypothetical protein
VTNGIKASKAMLVLLAPDTEVSEALDGKLSALIDEAQSRDVPILYCLTRRKLGKALHSSMKQAAVAIYDANGAYEQFRQIVRYALTAPPALPEQEQAIHPAIAAAVAAEQLEMDNMSATSSPRTAASTAASNYRASALGSPYSKEDVIYPSGANASASAITFPASTASTASVISSATTFVAAGYGPTDNQNDWI